MMICLIYKYTRYRIDRYISLGYWHLYCRPRIGLADPKGPDQGLYSASPAATGSLLIHSPGHGDCVVL